MEITFAELGLNEQILAGVATLGFSAPTPVQAAAIPAVLAGKDVVASAQTGTGKTADIPPSLDTRAMFVPVGLGQLAQRQALLAKQERGLG